MQEWLGVMSGFDVITGGVPAAQGPCGLTANGV
jgi:hypothetical protein